MDGAAGGPDDVHAGGDRRATGNEAEVVEHPHATRTHQVSAGLVAREAGPVEQRNAGTRPGEDEGGHRAGGAGPNHGSVEAPPLPSRHAVYARRVTGETSSP